MDRENAIRKFKEEVIDELIGEGKAQFKEIFSNNEELLKETILEGIKGLIKKAKQEQEKNINYKLAILHFELLRINILEENFKICLHGYNNLWYLDSAPIYKEIDLKFLFEPFIKIKQKLKEKKKSYIGKINDYDIEKVMFDPVIECYSSISDNVRSWLWDLDEEAWIKEDALSSFYVVKWGEYHDKSETLFAMDNREKTINDLLEFKNQPEEKQAFIYSVWKDSLLEEGDLTKQNMLFINFKGSKLKKINFSESDIIKGQFKNTYIKNCKFENARLIGTVFENSIFEDTNFNNANCMGVNFIKAEFSYVDFSNANLTKANFTNAKFDHVSFENANVEDAIFSERDIPFIHLTPKQLQVIYIEGGM